MVLAVATLNSPVGRPTGRFAIPTVSSRTHGYRGVAADGVVTLILRVGGHRGSSVILIVPFELVSLPLAIIDAVTSYVKVNGYAEHGPESEIIGPVERR